MDKPEADYETMGFDDKISEEQYAVHTASTLPFYDCDTSERFHVINPVNSILDDLKQTKCKLQILNKQLKDKSCPNDICVSSQEPNSSQRG